MSTPRQAKDRWDKIQALSGLISGTVVALVGLYATYSYNERQLEATKERSRQSLAVSRVEVAQRFFPELASGDERRKGAAIVAIAALGDEELATRLAGQFGGPGSAAALSRIAASPNPSIASKAKQTLSNVLKGVNIERRVYRIDARCTAEPTSRTGTGFRANGFNGIIVSLDIVAGCQVTVSMPAGDSSKTRQAEVEAVDADRGVAFLREALTASRAAPFDVLPLDSISPALDRLSVVGYAVGLSRPLVSGVQFWRDREPLNVLLSTRAMAFQGVPSPFALAIRINIGTCLPGMSGAPIVTDDGRVVAFIEMLATAYGTEDCWAFPVSELKPSTALGVLERVARRHATSLP